MPIKNYTTTVKPRKTIQEIEGILQDYGVRQMHKMFDADGEVEGIYFTIPFKDQMVHYKMPALVDEVRQIMEDDPDIKTYNIKEKDYEVAARCVAWRIIKDWIDSQLAMIEANLVEVHQVFLPYAYDPEADETLYDKFIQGNMPHLLTD